MNPRLLWCTELPPVLDVTVGPINGAAPNAGRAHVNLGTAGSAPADAAPPSAAQPVAWMYQHEETGNVNFRPHNERWADHRRYVEIPLYAAPPDLAARVEQLEGLLRELHPYLDSLICYASTRTEYKPNDIVARIDAALAEGE